MFILCNSHQAISLLFSRSVFYALNLNFPYDPTILSPYVSYLALLETFRLVLSVSPVLSSRSTANMSPTVGVFVSLAKSEDNYKYLKRLLVN